MTPNILVDLVTYAAHALYHEADTWDKEEFNKLRTMPISVLRGWAQTASNSNLHVRAALLHLIIDWRLQYGIYTNE